MRLIDADALIKHFKSDEEYFEKIGDTAFMFAVIGAINEIEDVPTIEAVSVVRCKDCKYCHYEQEDDIFHCDVTSHRFYFDNHYCSYGEPKEADHE